VKGGNLNHKRLEDIRKAINDPHVCWAEAAHEIAKELIAEVDRLGIVNQSLQSIASNGWVEAWHCGNGFMALPPDDDHGTVSRCWSTSQTLESLQRINSPTGFTVSDRVRIKFGRDRGHYGTIVSKGGDDGTYYGVKLDCHDKEVGYSEYELDHAKP